MVHIYKKVLLVASTIFILFYYRESVASPTGNRALFLKHNIFKFDHLDD